MAFLVDGRWHVGQYGFSSYTLNEIARNKLFVFVGDSVTRGIYKDFVKMLRTNDLLAENQLKKKGEKSFEDDRLVEGGVLEGLFNGKNYLEVREYRTSTHCVRFYFITRVYYDYVESILQDFMENPVPDFVYVSSCCWDVTRWSDEVKHGEESLSKYKANLQCLFRRMTEVLPEHTMVVWGCSLPVGQEVRGGFLEAESENLAGNLRLDILEANYFASQIAELYQFDVIDFHFFFRNHQEARKRDGIHWNSTAHRNITYMLMHHVSESWGLGFKPSVSYATKIASEETQEFSFNPWRTVSNEQMRQYNQYNHVIERRPDSFKMRRQHSYQYQRNQQRALQSDPGFTFAETSVQFIQQNNLFNMQDLRFLQPWNTWNAW